MPASLPGIEWIDSAEWPRHPRVKACFTTRAGGVSAAPYDDFNLALHVGDDSRHVQRNRRILRQQLRLNQEPAWLRQVHGTLVIDAGSATPTPRADASRHRGAAGPACVVLTADCLPVLFADDDGQIVAAAHAGWRGLAAGVLQRTVETLECAPAALSAWLGPAIGPLAFEVGPEVREAFVSVDAAHAHDFVSGREDRYLADLRALARRTLQRGCGISRVYGEARCTHAEADRFFSFRRDGACGRMASLVWIE